jgi:23S rRNA (cytosine1962-C5)-methyltransferase
MSEAAEVKGRLRLRLFPRAETAVRGGHPWVFADSIKSQNREGKTGELAVIYDKRDRFFAVGMYEAESPIRVRILHCGKPADIGREWWQQKARECLEKRQGDVLKEGTDGARMINGESEGFPGLVDRGRFARGFFSALSGAKDESEYCEFRRGTGSGGRFSRGAGR